MSFNNIVRMALTKCIEDRVCDGGLIMYLAKRTTIPCTRGRTNTNTKGIN
ncbi:hypothetical protein [Clostridium butyricum]